VHVDYFTTAARANELLQGAAPAGAAGEEFLDDLLPDWYDEWVIVRRERYRQLRLQALDALCDRLSAEQRYGDAVRVGLAAVAAEPLRESAHRAVVRAHIAEGNFAEALRHYEIYKRILAAELGLEPSGRMMALLETIPHC